MPGPLGRRDIYIYNSDDGNTYNVEILAAKADEGSFAPNPTGLTNYPRGWKMRKVYGEAADGTRIALPIAAANTSLFQSGGSFEVYGISFDVRGRIGEKRPS